MEKLNESTVEEVMGLEGEARGLVIKSDWDYVQAHYGEEGVRKVEARMAELGHPFPYREIKNMRYYPIGLDVLSMLVIREQLGFDDEEMIKMGAFGPTTSIILKVLMRYFMSVQSVLNNSPNIWKKHYTAGSLEAVEMDVENGRVVMELREFKTHPVHCLVIKGYLGKVLEMIVNRPVTVEESACAHEESDVHRFIITWSPK